MDTDPERRQRLRWGSREFLADRSPTSRIRRFFDHPLGFDRELWKQAAFLGWYGIMVAERYGGFTLTSRPLLDLVVVVEQHGRLVQPGPLVPTNVVAYAIDQLGTAQQKKDHLLAIASGETIATWCIADAPFRWDAANPGVTVQSHDRGYILNGKKVCVQDAEAANLVLLTAQSEAGPMQFVIPGRPQGVTLWPRKGPDPTRRLYDVHFDNVVVPASAQLGSQHRSREYVEKQLCIAKVLHCAESAAGGAQLIELCATELIRDAQHTSDLLTKTIANLRLASEIALANARNAAMAVADDREDAAIAVDVAEIVVHDVFVFIAEEAIRISRCETSGVDDDIQLYLRRALGNRVLWGNPGDHRNQLQRDVEEMVLCSERPRCDSTRHA